MANINMTTTSVGAKVSMGSSGVQRLTKLVKFSEVLAEKGSALAAADVIQVFDLPAGSLVLAAAVKTVDTPDVTALTLDVGFSDGTNAVNDPDQFVDGYDAVTGGVCTPLHPAAEPSVVVGPASAILGVTIATLTGTLNDGSVRVIALVGDLT